MLATAHIKFDRDYFESHYDDWLNYRSKWRKYEIWCASALTLFGVAIAIAFPHEWLVGAVFSCFGVYEFAMAATHRRRWVNARMASVNDNKMVDVSFNDDALATTSNNGTSMVKYSGFRAFTPASNGFFLIPDTGVSIYIPRATINPPTAYTSLVEMLANAVGSLAESPDGGEPTVAPQIASRRF